MSEQKIDDDLLDEATKWFVLMRADDISDNRAREFAQWISHSPRHQAAYIEIGGFWDGLPAPETQTSVHTPATSASSHKNTNNNHNHVGKRRWSRHLVAASVAFLILGFSAFHYGKIFLMDNRSTQVGELADIILDDGSHLELNTNSEVRIDLQKSKRIVYLERGEVFFDVTHDENRPFFVETSGGLVRVLGTKFNIRRKGKSSDVTVLQGAVGVIDYGRIKDNGGAMAIDVTLAPNQKFTLGNDEIANMAIPVNSRAALAWRDRKLIYNGESFETLIEDINRYYDGEIRIGDPGLKNIKIVAILKIEDRSATLKALETTFNVTARPVSKKLIMLYPNKK